MKLLGWMHQKLCRRSKEQYWMDFEGNRSSCLYDEKLLHVDQPTNRKCFKKMKETGIHEEDDQPHDHDELFHGFLAIGTLGLAESFYADPPTPTFPVSSQDVAADEEEMMNIITEDELELMNSELEKFLFADQAKEKEVADELSSPRSSQVSIITFSNKQFGDHDQEYDGDSEDCRVFHSSSEFPLQRYFFCDSIELPATSEVQKKPTAAGEILSICENFVKKYDSPDKPHKQRGGATHFMKNILRKLLHSADRSCTTAASNEKATKSGAIFKKKLPEVLKLKFLHRKIHPALGGPIAEKPRKEEIPKVYSERFSNNPNYGEFNERCPTFNSVQYSERSNRDDTTVNRGRWITTDDDYIVLEL